MRLRSTQLVVCALCCAAAPVAARAQSAPPPSPTPPAAVQADPDLSLQPAEPDFALAALPTSLRLPRGKMAFRLTHRFSYNIDQGTAADFVRNFFGLDSHADMGLEVRYGLVSGTQFVVHRTNDRDIQMLGQRQVVRQGATGLAAVDALVAVEGQDNFSANFSETVGAIVSRRFHAGAIYVEPMGVIHANPIAGVPQSNSMLLGVGARLRVGRSTYLVAETAPRLAGYGFGQAHVSVAIEKRAGGHLFQLNISNDLGTTIRQITAGGLTGNHWHIGFNLTRKFF
jgi:hypothetical protein